MKASLPLGALAIIGITPDAPSDREKIETC